MTLKTKTTKSKLLFSIIAIALLASCQQPVKNVTDKTGKTIIAETVLYNQTGILDSTINYCCYLPKAYNGIDKLPVIFFFDPHANGKIPVNKYATLSNKYGYIFIAGNNIKNGQPASFTHSVFKKLMLETKHRFVVDEKRLFTAGFSGGAKLATIFAQQMPKIIGVIACGGNLPLANNFKPNYYYAGIVGNKDFNYLEAHQTFSAFDQQGFDYTSVIFDGGHQWPPSQSFEMGLIGLNIYSIKLKRLQKNDKWLDDIWQRMNDSISLFNKNSNPIKENFYLSQTIRWFYGLKNIKELKKQSYNVENSELFYNYAKKRQLLIRKEVQLRSEFIRAIEFRNLNWWHTEINSFNESIKQSNKEVILVTKRLLNYLSMVSFMLTKTDLDDGNLDNVAKKLKIYELVDADNPDVYLMYARYYMLLNDVKAMKQSFKKAQNHGFKNYGTYKNDASWKTLFEREEILSMM